MPLLKKFDPPARLPDFEAIAARVKVPGSAAVLADQWSRYISACFDVSIAELLHSIPNPPGDLPMPQFYNATRVDAGSNAIEQPVVWNAFPKRLLTRFGRRRALEAADQLWPFEQLTSGAYDPLTPANRKAMDAACAGSRPRAIRTRWARPHDEYCEWRVERDARGGIRRVTFTSEPPEYWTALFGGEVGVGDTDLKFRFLGDEAYCAQLYAQFLGHPVLPGELSKRKSDGGGYDPLNGWNTTHGIAHLSNIDVNSIAAEIKLAADSTILRLGYQGPAPHWSSPRGLAVHPEHLCCVSSYGDPARNSDPTIGACGNALARAGALFTLKNPVGIYMNDIDTSGWALRGRRKPVDWTQWCVVERGDDDHIGRLVVQAPAGAGATLADLMIGGEKLEFGGQLAECITVRLTGIGTISHHLQNPAAVAVGQGWLPLSEPRMLTTEPATRRTMPSRQLAFGRSVVAADMAAPPLRRGSRRTA